MNETMKRRRLLTGSFLIMVLLIFVTFPRIAYAQSTMTDQSKQEMEGQKGNEGFRCRCVAFRLDDVGDSNNPDIENRLLNIFQNSNTSLTIGIIGNRFGNNQQIVSHLAALLSGHGPRILEVANHGWNHEDFSALSLEEQIALMQKTNGRIYSTLKVNPTVFIAPFNKINNSTFLAAKQSGINTVSSGPTVDPPANSVSPDAMGMYHLPFSAATAYVDKDGKNWDPVPLATIENDILNGLKNHGYSVVEMHPQEFVIRYQDKGSGELIDESHLATIESLIQWLYSERIDVVKIGSFATDNSRSNVPEFQSSLPLVATSGIASVIAVIRILGRRKGTRSVARESEKSSRDIT